MGKAKYPFTEPGQFGEWINKIRKGRMLINLTPHTVEFPDNIIIPSSGCARVEMTETIYYIDGVQVKSRDCGETTGLPDPKPGVILIVSSTLRLANPERTDLASPYLIQKREGNILKAGCLLINTI